MKLLIQCLSIIAIICACVRTCPDEPNCLECLNSDKDGKLLCSFCENSFLDSASNLCAAQVTTPLEFCKKYLMINDKLTCNFCERGYYVNTDGTCKKCALDKCALCNDTYCQACFNSVVFNQDRNKCDDGKKCTAKNCSVCQPVGDLELCIECDSGFALDNNLNECLPDIPNCFSISKAADKKCARCQFGYFITKDGVCQKDQGSSHMWILWLFLGVVLLGIVGYFGYQHFQKQQNNRDVYLNA
jgi:hypothetical protein